jgi:hypothetical protein
MSGSTHGERKERSPAIKAPAKLMFTDSIDSLHIYSKKLSPN